MKKTLLSPSSNCSNSFQKFFALVLLIIGGAFNANAQVSSYLFSESTGNTYTDITGGTQLLSGAAWSTMASFQNYTLPFTFYYNNIGYTSVSISDNGYIVLGTVGTLGITAATPISGATTNESAIACFAYNLAGGSAASEVRYEVLGSSPNRVFVVQYKDVVRRTLANQNGLMNMQIRLYETTGVIETLYGAGFTSTYATSLNGQVGLRGTTNADFNSRKNVGTTWVPTTTNGGATSTDVMQTSSTIGYAAGTKFTWSPCSSPTGIAIALQADNSTLNVSWTSPVVIPAGGFDWEVRTSGNPGSGAAGLFLSGNTTASSVSVPGLQIGVPYYVYVKSNCKTTWLPVNTAPSTLTVTPTCTIASLPYTQNFESVTAPAIPACNTIATPTGAAMQTVNNSSTPYYGFNNKNLITIGALQQDSWYFTQAVNIPAAGDYRLSYKYGGTRQQVFLQQKMKVYFGQTATPAGMLAATLLADHNDIKDSPLFNVINFTVTTPGTYYVAFYGYALPSQGFLQLDDIVLDVASCKKPTNLVSGQVTSSTALISWAEPTPVASDGYDYYILPVTGTVVPSGGYTVGSYYRILTTGSTSFTAIGSSSNSIGTIFQATGVGAGTGTAQLITTVPAISMVAGKVYQVVSLGTTNYTLVGGANTIGSFFLATGAGAGTGVVQLVTPPLSSQVPTGTTLAGGIVANLSPLTSSTSYYYWVRSKCGGGETGSWSLPNIFTTSVNLTYCTPAPTSVDGTGITNVTFGSINNTTGDEPGHYRDYTTLSTNIAQTTTVNVSITFNTSIFNYNTVIWVDWNNDGDFYDAGEVVATGLSSTTSPNTLILSFVVPTLDSGGTNTIGPHRMRIGGADIDTLTGTGAGQGPCYNSSWATFEDYSVYVTVAPPALTLFDGVPGSHSNTICAGSDTSGSPVTVSSNHNSFQVYTWSPNNGTITGDINSGFVFSPSETTTYILTGTQTSGTFSSNSASYTVNVDPMPSTIAITPANPTVCLSDTTGTLLTATGGIVPGEFTPVFSENFNSATNTFTTTNTSINGTPANAAWALHASPYSYGGTFSSNDSSQFYMSNSDSQGSAGTTNTELISPVFDLTGYIDASLSFWHYYRGWGSGAATVEISTDGGTTYTVLPSATWNTNTVGSSNSFVNKTINLSAYVGMSNLRIKFKYANANWGWYWAIDNVLVYGSNTSAITWSPTTGLYNDVNLSSPYLGGVTSTVYARPNATTTYTASADSMAGCTTDTSFVVTVVPITGGTTSGNQFLTCSNTPTAITVSGYSGTITQWQYSPSATFASGVGTIANATATLGISDIGTITSNRYFRAVVTNGACTAYSTVSGIIVTRTIWDGTAWDNGTPDSTKAVEFQGNYSGGSMAACSVLVTNGAVVSFAAGQTLTVEGEVKVVSPATLSFADTASLYQVQDVSNSAGPPVAYNGNGGVVGNGNSGLVSFARTTTPIRYYDYTYWSTPVFPQTLVNISPLSPYLGYYNWNIITQAWNWSTPNGVMAPGKGYIIRAPETYSLTAGAPFTATFYGVPNNGTITTTIAGTGTGQVNLIGNPYPSAFDANAFLTHPTNATVMGGALYFWTHNTDITNGSYTGNDYSIYNLSGGSAANSGGVVPSRYVNSGQAFFVYGSTPGVATFKNSMRVAGLNNAFVKTGNAAQDVSDASDLERHRYWLDIKNDEGAFKEVLVAYVETATMDLDRLFDAEMIEVGNAVTMYTKVADKKLTIQGRSLPFEVSDLVPLSYSSTVAGSFTINIRQYDGLFADQHVYLEDKVLNVIHDLSAAEYVFATEAGTFEDRFVLRYTDATLGVSTPNFDENTVVLYRNATGLHINTGAVNMATVTIFDIRGREIAVQKGIAATQTTFTNLPEAHQVLLVKITGENGKTVTKKVVY